MPLEPSEKTSLPATREPAAQVQSVPRSPGFRLASGAGNQRARTDHLSGTEKAAIIVRALLAEGSDLTLATLPQDMQADLTQTLGRMRLVDRATMNAVIEDFIETLEQVGLSFPDTLEGALALLGDRLDQKTVRRLRDLSRGGNVHDVWHVLERADDDALQAVLESESQVVGAVLLSKLSTEKAAGLLVRLEPDLAKALALSIGRTEAISPAAVARIGATLAQQITDKPERAFMDAPTKRIGNILNSSAPGVRENLLAELESTDSVFARDVRRSIFTFKDIATRVQERDVPAIIREVQSADLTTVIAANNDDDIESLTFLLENMSKRAAANLQDEASALPSPSADAHEAACARIAGTVRLLVDREEIRLKPQDTGA